MTGGARGIGRAYARRLAQLGADVAIVDRDLTSFQGLEAGSGASPNGTTLDDVRDLGRRAYGVTADLAQVGAAQAAIEEVAANLGVPEIVVCNAGGGSGSMADSRPSRATDEHIRSVVDGNLVATIATCRSALDHLRGRGWGRIVTISSQAGRRVYPDGGYSIYGAAKAGIALYTRALAQEVGPDGITANCIAPGYIETQRLAPMFAAMSEDGDLRDRIALRRYGTPDDCAGVLEFLVTDLGAYVTGAVIPVDGGSTD